MITVFGYGSLVSKKSAQATCPDLQNFRKAKIKNVWRVFGKVHLTPLRNGTLDLNSKKIATCFIEEKSGYNINGVAFEIPESSFQNLINREYDYEQRTVELFNINGKRTGTAQTFFGYNNDLEIIKKRPETQTEFWPEIRKIYNGDMYRKDILPSPPYLDFCLETFKTMGQEFYENFLTHTVLSDQKTTISDYLSGTTGTI